MSGDNEKMPAAKSGTSGLIFVGCLMLGLAYGLLTGNTAVGLIAGLGVGFLGMALARFAGGTW
jgi:hypothetical protein